MVARSLIGLKRARSVLYCSPYRPGILSAFGRSGRGPIAPPGLLNSDAGCFQPARRSVRLGAGSLEATRMIPLPFHACQYFFGGFSFGSVEVFRIERLGTAVCRLCSAP